MADEGTSSTEIAAAAAADEAEAEPAVVVVGEQFAATEAVDLTVIRYDVLTFMDVDLYRVLDADGNVLFKVNRVIFNSRLVLLDAAGKTLLTMKKDQSGGLRGMDLNFYKQWNVFRGKGKNPSDLLFSIRKCSLLESDKFKVRLAANTDRAATCDFMINGNGRSTKCTISIGQSDTIIAQMHCKRAFLQPSKLLVTVNPNIDCVFIVSLLTILEELRRSSQGITSSVLNLGLDLANDLS
ncbi:protein LURP-one-related 10-like [Curcuma longa]|uniref:protein LURP-one-related 10-like n=1 Tax=Curcuma longa TaxID=136217 RepID=UPI003D9EFEF2